MPRPLILTVLVLAACGPDVSKGDIDAHQGNPIDASQPPPPVDAHGLPDTGPPADARGNVYGDADLIQDGGGLCTGTTCANPVADGCGQTELCGDDGSGDGLDNDCSGKVDDACHCIPGDVRPCFAGPPGRRGVGACQDGMMRCVGTGELGDWSECMGGISPTGEVCDSLDNNCNGCADDNPLCCDVNLHCPGPGEVADGTPFNAYTIDGTQFFNGNVTSWTWTIVGGPCDQLLAATAGKTSFSVSGANTSTVTFVPTLSGDYTVTMTAVGADGNTYTCTFIVHVRGPGLRVELCWDQTGPNGADVNLHLHKPGTTTPWFATQPNCAAASCYNYDDCYYADCKANPYPQPPGLQSVDWGYPSISPPIECQGGPEGAAWAALGFCRNPRLDVDNIATLGIPENINLDLPRQNEKFRIMVHYYGYNFFPLFCPLPGVTVHPMVNIYCGGYLKATYGANPDVVGGFDCGGGFAAGPMWRVADVTTTGSDANGNTTCDIKALHPNNGTSGYWVTQNDTSY